MAVAKQPELTRQLGFLYAVSIVVGVVIGAGIFLVPTSLVARTLPSTEEPRPSGCGSES
jgi:amino acid transporter